MALLFGTLLILMLLLAFQYAWMSERRKSRFGHSWFSKSKLSANRMRWWKWVLVFGFIFGGLCFFSQGWEFSIENLLLFIILLSIDWLCMKPIARLSSFRRRIISEAILIFILTAGLFFGYEILLSSRAAGSDQLFSQEASFWKRFFWFAIPAFIWLLLTLHMVRYYITFVPNKRQEKALKLSRLRTQLTTARLDALQTRINPHFLYNALNSIAALALTDGHSTRRMALALSRFFSYCSDPKAPPQITLGEEIEIATTYLEIEKIRFGEKIDFQTHISPETVTALIPRLVLQPLVENAVKHGMSSDIPILSIRIEAYLSDHRLIISVQDNGRPFAEDLEPGYGLKSIYDRMDILFPGQYEITLQNTPQKEVCITLNKVVKNSDGKM